MASLLSPVLTIVAKNITYYVTEVNEVNKLVCGHSFHSECSPNNGCMICTPLLAQKVQSLANKYNKTLAKSVIGKYTQDDQCSDDDTKDTESEEVLPQENDMNMETGSYYKSSNFNRVIEDKINSIPMKYSILTLCVFS